MSVDGKPFYRHRRLRVHTLAKQKEGDRVTSAFRIHRLGSRTFTLVVALGLFFNLAGPVAAAEQVPFKGSLSGTVTVTPLTPPFASVLIAATGNATHLGRFTLEIPHQVNQAIRVGAGTYEFTAANGDTLTADFTGTATLLAPGILSTSEAGTITGGTGRFAGATGSFTAERMFFVATGVTTGSFEGSISSVGGG